MNEHLHTDFDVDRSLVLLAGKQESVDQKFNLKMKLRKIEKLARDNSILRAKLEGLRLRLDVERHPLLLKFFQARLDNLELLELHLGQVTLKRKEKELIIQLIIQGAAEIWQLGELRAAAILNRYLDQGSEDEEDDDGASKEAQGPFREGPGPRGFRETPDEDHPGKSAEAAGAGLALELKFLYHKLVKLLHPDREQDEARKQEKTHLLKKVSEAYQNSDVHTLLSFVADYLGLGEIEGRIGLYLKELNKKIKRLKDEKLELTRWGPLAQIYRNVYSRNPAKVDLRIRAQLEALRLQIKEERSCAEIYADESYLKTYLRKVWP